MKPAVIFFFLYFLSLIAFAQTWQSLNGGVNQSGGGQIFTLGTHNNKLYVGGAFESAGSIPAYRVASWDGSTWDSLGSGFYLGVPYCNTPGFNSLFWGGTFQSAGGVQSKNIALWDGSAWLPGNFNATSASNVYTLAEYDGEVYAGGNFLTVSGMGQIANRIARWNDTAWKAVGGGVTGGFIPEVLCMAVYNGELFIGGDFTIAGSTNANNIARWNGVKWDSVGSGFNDRALNMVVDTISNLLYVSGYFTKAGDSAVNYIAKWDGNNWSPVGNPLTTCNTLCMYKNRLFMGGAKGANSIVLAFWDGNNWQNIPGPNHSVSALQVYNDELYVGGIFDKVDTGDGELTVNYIARLSMPPLDTSTKDSIEKKIRIFPNPSEGSFFLEIPGSHLKKTEISICDARGKMVLHKKIRSETSEILTQQWAKGIYLVDIHSEGRIIATEKFVIE